ncbi:glycoside hydrolase family 19 protein [Chitinophaga ginsengisoli]|uniref:Putative secreted protein (Por secretion system target) n=1 Tax=Chitinophaga ginsengisoli TaxID=363837 RepID=A0A2P8FTG4_9BACT|nr:glycoside hydrolase family 19 protein [Chitinophaga ginsengisoli]PSL25016.1 putative secreted protein (Por secretion system target) [Chitinophaga ginsengisoli]
MKRARFIVTFLLLCCMSAANAQTISDVITSADWDVMFPHRFNPDDRSGSGIPPSTPAKDFYSYANFTEAVRRMSNIKILSERRCATNAYKLTRVDKTTGATVVIRKDADFDISSNAIIQETIDYATFAGEGDLSARKRELSAFLANISQETTGGWPTAPGGPYAWGLYFREEVGYEGTNNIGYRIDDPMYPPAPGKSYHGRGPIQLSYNYNYGQASEFIFGDKNVLLANPEKVIQDGVIAFETGIWFWMAQQYPKPSCHDVMISGKWTPTASQQAAGLKPGFGATVNIINGGIECGSGTENTKVLGRIGHYQRYTGIKQVSMELNGGNNAANCGCATMPPFAIDNTECAQITALKFTSPSNGIMGVTSLAPVTLTVSKSDPRNEITQVFIKIGGLRLSGTSVQWTPTAYGAQTATAVGLRNGKDSIVTTISFTIWNTQTFEGCASLPAWESTKIYETAGNIVKYNNVIYRNQWWAGSGDVPGTNTTWAVVGACNGNGGDGGGTGQPCDGIAGWTQGGIYTAGTKVAYGKKIYQAKWWTQGDQPDQNTGDGKPWTFVSNCSASLTSVTTAVVADDQSTIAKGSLKVYPNPVTGNTLSVAVDGGTEKVLLSLVNTKTGQIVLQQVVTPAGKGTQQVQLDISKVPAGVWILKADKGRFGVIGTSKIVRLK